MPQQFRRIVTGHNQDGKSIIVSDGMPGAVGSGGHANWHEMWITDRIPADNATPGDAADRPISLEPPENGSVFRFVQLDTESSLPSIEERHKEWEGRIVAMDEEARKGALRIRPDTSRHPGMHRTKTVDYIILLKGEVTMLLDEDEVDLNPFDVVVQRGTNHAWVNKGSEPALLAAVQIDALSDVG